MVAKVYITKWKDVQYKYGTEIRKGSGNSLLFIIIITIITIAQQWLHFVICCYIMQSLLLPFYPVLVVPWNLIYPFLVSICTISRIFLWVHHHNPLQILLSTVDPQIWWLLSQFIMLLSRLRLLTQTSPSLCDTGLMILSQYLKFMKILNLQSLNYPIWLWDMLIFWYPKFFRCFGYWFYRSRVVWYKLL